MRDPVRRLKLYEALKSDIASGVYLSGGFLPNEFELAEKYGYSRDTVRSTLTMLEDDKLVELLKGKGRRICPAHIEKAKVPLTFLLPCPDFLSETVLDISAQNARRMLKGFSQVAFEYDYRVETVPVSPTNNEHDIDWRKLDFVNKDSRIVLAGYWYCDLFQMLLERRCRMVFIRTQNYRQKIYTDFIKHSFCITTNVFGAVENAVKHLAEAGCSRIALLSGHLSEPEQPTMNGYLSGIAKRGLAFSAWHDLPLALLTLADVNRHLRDFYRKCGGFDGLLVDASYLVHLHLRDLYRELKIPKTVKLLIMSDIEGSQRMTPTLSCVAFPYEEIGRNAAMRLLDSEFQTGGEELINARLIERESTLIFSEKTELVSV